MWEEKEGKKENVKKKKIRKETPSGRQHVRPFKLQLAPFFPLAVRRWALFVGYNKRTYMLLQASARVPDSPDSQNTSPGA
jgi:hypothetical protein